MSLHSRLRIIRLRDQESESKKKKNIYKSNQIKQKKESLKTIKRGRERDLGMKKKKKKSEIQPTMMTGEFCRRFQSMTRSER